MKREQQKIIACQIKRTTSSKPKKNGNTKKHTTNSENVHVPLKKKIQRTRKRIRTTEK